MATSTKSTGRARSTPARGAGTTARKTAGTTTSQKTVKFAATETKPSLFVRMWMGLAHVAGGAARALGPEQLSKEERRDGLPFFLVLLSIAGAVIEWFLINDPVAQTLDAWTFGALFGRLAFALPVILLLFAIWLFRNPSSVHDNGRIGIGLSLLLVTVSGLCHIFGGQPAPSQGMEVLALSGGVIGWMIAAPLIFLIQTVGAAIVVILLLILSLFIITKTPPNKIGERSRELYAWLFGAPLPAPEERAAAKEARQERIQALKTKQIELDGLDPAQDDETDEAALPWWRRNNSKREEDPDFSSAISSSNDDEADPPAVDPLSTLLNHGADAAKGGFDTALESTHTPPPRVQDHYGTEVLEDLLKAEEAIKRHTGEIDAVPRATGLHADDPAGLTEVLPGLDELDEAATAVDRSAEFGFGEQPALPYVLPSATTLTAGPPAKARSAANDEVVKSITEVLRQFSVDARVTG
ncbi:MAG: DNA translocase FtsK 4TM domain-containing protein [Cryobacterium sp.]